MPLYELDGVAPRIDADAFVHPDAVVIGDVTIGPESSVWPGAVLRGDYGTITVGAGTSIQDGTVIHAGPNFPTIIGDGCVVGHLTHLEGCTLEDESLAGSGCVVLHWAVIERAARRWAPTRWCRTIWSCRRARWPSVCRRRSSRASRTCP